MAHSMNCWLLSCLVAGFVLLPAALAADEATFETAIRPILKAACFECHGEGEKLSGNLDLRLRHLVVKGGTSGPAIAPGKADASLLLKRVRLGEMPPGKKKLSAEQIAVLDRWVANGAKVTGPEPATIAPGLLITPEDRAFWFFQPVKRPTVPATTKDDHSRTPIDAFLLDKMRGKQLAFAPDADKRILIRRATFDLTGLPPTLAEIDAFIQDNAADAYEKLVDRLLASPHYGERWGRHWLDVAGYADSEGYGQDDTVRTNAWRYRDYVIRSFNEDRPFDRFIHEQIAGDEMIESPGKYTPADIDRLIATGFLRMAPDGTGQPNVEQKAARNQVITDTIKIVSTAFLGLTVNCAQCHHHRYDPIPQDDYYRLRALIEPAYDVQNWKTPARRDVSLLGTEDVKQAKLLDGEAGKLDAERVKLQGLVFDETLEKVIAALPAEKRELAGKTAKTPANRQTAEMKAIIKQHPDVAMSLEVQARLDPVRAKKVQTLSKAAGALRAKKPKETLVRALTETPGQIPTTYLFHRGDYDQPKQAVAPGGLTIVDQSFPLQVPAKPANLSSTGRRTTLARWLTDERNPFTARVLVNRVWLNHFGRGIVATPGDFGKLGERPTHPELLDWLASEFVRDGWSMKKLHRLVMTSTVYRQDSRRDPERERIDPDNKLYSRMSVRRLDAESVRDTILNISGKLEMKAFGPPVPVKDTEAGQFILGIENKDGAGRFLAEIPLPPGEEYRRSVYVQVRRSKPYYVLDTFDAAAVEPVCEIRNSSTVTPQALLLMNSDFIMQQSLAFASRLEREAESDLGRRVRLGWQLAFGKEPTPAQVAAAVAFVKEQTKLLMGKVLPPPKIQPKGTVVPHPDSVEHAALASWCQALLSANEFLYLD